jgi:hypothetical protein
MATRYSIRAQIGRAETLDFARAIPRQAVQISSAQLHASQFQKQIFQGALANAQVG